MAMRRCTASPSTLSSPSERRRRDRDNAAVRGDAGRRGGRVLRLPAVNVTSSETLNGALRGFAEARSDGIVQVTTGAGAFLSGGAIGDMALGARALAEYTHVVGEHYPVLIALHTDHATPDRFDGFAGPLIEESRPTRRVW
jgi:hypothetical protein